MKSRFSRLLENISFRATVIATLLVLSAFFVVRPDVHGRFSENAGDQAGQASQHNERDKVFFGLSPEGWTAVWTFGLFGATVALFVATYALFDTASRESDKAEEAIKIAKISAEASQLSADVARNTLIASHRAWIKIVGVKIISPLRMTKDGPFLEIQLELENVGNSVALQVGSKIWLLIENKNTHNMLGAIHNSQVERWMGEEFLWNFIIYPQERMQVDPRISVCTYAFMPNGEWIRAAGDTIPATANIFIGGVVTYRYTTDDNVHAVSFWRSVDQIGNTSILLRDGTTCLQLGERFWNGEQAVQIAD